MLLKLLCILFVSYNKFVNQTKDRSWIIKIQLMLHSFAGSTKSLDCIGCSEASKGLNVILRIHNLDLNEILFDSLFDPSLLVDTK